MPRYRVDALEKFLVRTTYSVEARDAQEAERLCRDGKVAYESHEIAEGDDEWIETRSVALDSAPRSSKQSRSASNGN